MDTGNDSKLKILKDQKIQATPEIKKKRRGGVLSKLFVLVLIVWLGYSQYELYMIKNPAYQQKIAEKQVSSIMKKVSKLMVLPVGQPQVIVIQDANQIKGQQQFFKNAENGDIVLVYPESAIIYSPSRNKIINVGPVINDTNQNTVPQVKNTEVNTTTATTSATTKR